MTDTLSEFRRYAAGRRFQFGEWDCGLLCADWVLRVTGSDPAAEWRGRYRTLLGLLRILKRRGGLVAHFDACLSPLGIQRTEVPRRGDIAIVAAPHEEGAVILGSMVMMAARIGGGVILRARTITPVIVAWGLDYAAE